MLINKIELIGYKRLMLKNIKRLHLEFSAILQIILGTNGSGKSSLLAELSPFPAASSDFTKEGSKTIEISHQGNYYVLISQFKNGTGRHSFFKNGDSVEDNLNPGGTATVQRELCSQEFGITEALHDLLTGKIKFTQMSPSQRNTWIMALSTMDLTLANRVFNTFKTQTRDAVGALKHIQARLTAESHKLTDYEGMDNLETVVAQLQTELTIMMENRELGLPNSWEIDQSITDALSRLSQLSKQTLKMRLVVPSNGRLTKDHTIHDVEQALAQIQQERNIYESLHANATEEYAELDSVIMAIGNMGSDSVDDVASRLATLQEEAFICNQLITEDLIEGNVEDVLNDTNSVMVDIIPVLNNLPKNPNRQFNKIQYDSAKGLLEEQYSELNRVSNKLGQLEARKEHIHSAKDTNCPKCKYVWKAGVSENELSELVAQIELLYAQIDRIRLDISSTKELIDQTEVYITQLRTFNSVCSSYPRLKLLWNKITVEEILYENPLAAMPVLQTWVNDVKASFRLAQLNQSIKQLEETIEHIKLLNSNGSSHTADRIASLKDKIENTTAKLVALKSEYDTIKTYRDLLIKAGENKWEIVRLIQLVESELTLKQRSIRDGILKDYIGQHQTTLAINQTKLNERQTLLKIIEDLKSSHSTVALEREAMQLILDELNPKDGLIADYLMSSIHGIVSNINRVIEAVWTQPLIVQDCSNQNGELDYKFPFINSFNDSELVPDIALGSSAQVDIINFAFVYIVYTHLGLRDFPLYLDEIGRTFDEQHRTNIMNFIRSTIDTRQFSQVFLISHYAGQHGSFANSETLVLDGTNISVPLIHNKHAIIE